MESRRSSFSSNMRPGDTQLDIEELHRCMHKIKKYTLDISGRMQHRVAKYFILVAGIMALVLFWICSTVTPRMFDSLPLSRLPYSLPQYLVSSEDIPLSSRSRPLASRQFSWWAFAKLGLLYTSFICYVTTFIGGLVAFQKLRILTQKCEAYHPAIPFSPLYDYFMEATRINEFTNYLDLSYHTAISFIFLGSCEVLKACSPIPQLITNLVASLFEAIFIGNLCITWAIFVHSQLSEDTELEDLKANLKQFLDEAKVTCSGFSPPKSPFASGDRENSDSGNGSPIEVMIFDDNFLETWLRKEFSGMDGENVLRSVKMVMSIRLGRPMGTFIEEQIRISDLERISLSLRGAIVQVLVDAMNREIESWSLPPGPGHDSVKEEWKPWFEETFIGIDVLLGSVGNDNSEVVFNEGKEYGEMIVRLLGEDEAIARNLLRTLSSCLSQGASLKDEYIPAIHSAKPFVNLILGAQELALTGQSPPAGLAHVVKALLYHVEFQIVRRYQQQIDDFWAIVGLENEITAEEEEYDNDLVDDY
ncbi:hypothetical protein ABKN59_003595 [Abortiporus biennis]